MTPSRKGPVMVRRAALGVVATVIALVGMLLSSPQASSYSLRYTQSPGNVTFANPMAAMGLYGSGQNNLQLYVNTVGPSGAAGQQYAVIFLRAYRTCSTGWCNAAQHSWSTPWFYPGQTLNYRGAVFSIQVPTGQYYTYLATTTWYNASGHQVGQETYYPTTGSTGWIGSNYYGNRDFACVAYAMSRGVCHPYGLGAASFSPTGSLYVLRAF